MLDKGSKEKIGIQVFCIITSSSSASSLSDRVDTFLNARASAPQVLPLPSIDLQKGKND